MEIGVCRWLNNRLHGKRYIVYGSLLYIIFHSMHYHGPNKRFLLVTLLYKRIAYKCSSNGPFAHIFIGLYLPHHAYRGISSSPLIKVQS